MAKDGRLLIPLTEPIIRPCVFITGWGVEISDSVRLIGWCELPDLGGETRERRIEIRAAMTNPVGRELERKLNRLLTKGGH